MTSDSEFIQHIPCENCGSSDANSLYSDSHQFCFSCHHYVPGDGEDDQLERRPRVKGNLITGGRFKALRKRGITEETCRKFGYKTAEYHDQPCQVAPYFDDDRNMVAQKVRFPNKEFTFLGSPKDATLFGQTVWSPGGRKLVITEGEIDALSMSQAQGNKWPVVSVRNGASGAVKCIRKSLDYVNSFDEVVIMFDMDEPGQKAAKEVADLLTPGKAKIAQLPHKDPNETLLEDGPQALITAMWQAQEYRPDGIVSGQDLLEEVMKEDVVVSVPYPWEALNELTRGQRQQELVTWTAGSGIGKSAVIREVAHDLVMKGERVGMLMLEESTKRTALGLMGISCDKPLHLDRKGVSDEELKAAYDAALGSGNVYLYDHFGSTGIDNLLSRVRYMAVGLECRWIFLDHLSIVVSGLGDGDERRLIDNAMTALRTLVQETGIGLHIVSHLKRPEGKGHEEGAKTALAQLRGSHAIAQLSDMVIGLERNQQGDNPNLTTLRVLKNRFSGQTGESSCLQYNPLTGRLHEVDPDDPYETEEEDEF